jgi:hypothetical protein
MGLKTENKCYVHNLLFADNEVIIIRVQDANYMGRKLEEYEKWGLKINYGKMEYLGTDHSEGLQINANTIPIIKEVKCKKGLVKQ